MKQSASLILLGLPLLFGCGGGSTSAEAPRDTTPPVITLVGGSTTSHEQGTVVIYSDGQIVNAGPLGFTVVTN